MTHCNETQDRTETATPKKFQATTCGPRQFTKVKKALGSLTFQRGSFVEVRGIEGQPDTYTRTHVTAMFSGVKNPRADELLAEVGERFSWEVTKENANALALALTEAAKEAEDAAPEVFDLTPPAVIERRKADAIERDAKRGEHNDEARAAWQSVLDQRPPDAVRLIVAELDEDRSDLMSDYHGHTTTRQVAIGWRTGQRESFPQMRRAAATFPDTSHLGLDAAPSVEHRENYSMGQGTYLKDGYGDSSGWRVKAIGIPTNLDGHLSFAIEDALPKVSASTASTGTALECGGFTITEETNKRGTFWLVILADRVDRTEFETLRTSAKACGGWYSRKWGKTPGGFGFDSQETAQAWIADARGDGDDTPPDDGGKAEAKTEENPEHVTRYVITHVGSNGMRALADTAQGRFTYATKEDAADALTQRLEANSPEHLASVYPAPDSLMVSPCQCWATHHDPVGVYFDLTAQDRRNAEAQRLEGLADAMQEAIDHKRSPLTQNPTPRRLGIKEGQHKDADQLEKTQEALRALASAQRANAVPSTLAGLSTRKAVSDTLNAWNPPKAKAAQRDALRALVEEHGTSRTAEREDRHAEQEKAKTLDSLRWAKIPGFFPTPPKVAERLVEILDPQPGDAVLEPSAGTGVLVQAVIDAQPQCKRIAVVERMLTLSDHLQETFKGRPEVFVYGDDFDTFESHADAYDRVAMNPPFEKGAGVRHTVRAAGMLAEGGRLVAVLPPMHADKVMADRRLTAFDMYVEELPEGSFNGADAFKRTGVSTCLLVIDR